MSETSRTEQSRIAGIIAVRFVVVLSVLAGVENLVAFGALQAALVPVASQGRLPLGEVDGLVAFGTDSHI